MPEDETHKYPSGLLVVFLLERAMAPWICCGNNLLRLPADGITTDALIAEAKALYPESSATHEAKVRKLCNYTTLSGLLDCYTQRA
jgi:hypothetical protein